MSSPIRQGTYLTTVACIDVIAPILRKLTHRFARNSYFPAAKNGSKCGTAGDFIGISVAHYDIGVNKHSDATNQTNGVGDRIGHGCADSGPGPTPDFNRPAN